MSALSTKAQARPAGRAASADRRRPHSCTRRLLGWGNPRPDRARPRPAGRARSSRRAQWRDAAEPALARLDAGGNVRDARGRLRLAEPGEAAVARYLRREGRPRAHLERPARHLARRQGARRRRQQTGAAQCAVAARRPERALRAAGFRPGGAPGALAIEAARGAGARRARARLRRQRKERPRQGLGAVGARRDACSPGNCCRSPREFADRRQAHRRAVRRAGGCRSASTPTRCASPCCASCASVDAPISATADRQSPPAGRARIGTAAAARSLHITTGRNAAAPWTWRNFPPVCLAAARTRAEGWPGNRKAFISQVWDAIRTSHPEWGLSEIEFKCMLAEAHRAGQLVLADADLKDKQQHQGARGLRDPLQEHRLALRARRRLRRRRLPSTDAAEQEVPAPALAPDRLFAAFEHSITWEDDIWRADPVDVAEVHAKARRKFDDLLIGVDRRAQGAGRAGAHPAVPRPVGRRQDASACARCAPSAHRAGTAYFGYAQMTPDVANYADYYLRRLVHSLEKPYDPDRGGESGARAPDQPARRRRGVLSAADLEKLREAQLDDGKLAQLVLQLADDIVASPKFADAGARHQHRARAALSAARAIRASTSACASTCTAASSPRWRTRPSPRSIPTPARTAPSRSSPRSAR